MQSTIICSLVVGSLVWLLSNLPRDRETIACMLEL